jgi:hypothetical protein
MKLTPVHPDDTNTTTIFGSLCVVLLIVELGNGYKKTAASPKKMKIDLGVSQELR